MIEIRSPQARLAVSFRAIALLALVGAAVGLAIGLGTIRGSLVPFFTANQIGPTARRFTLLFVFGGAGVFAATGIGFLLRGRDRAEAAGILCGTAQRLSPLTLVCFPILLFRRQVWVGKDLAFLTMVALFVLAACAATTAAARAPAFRWEAPLVALVRRFVANLDPRGRLREHLPFGVVLAGVLLYVVIVSRTALGLQTASVASSPELVMADHLMWNLLHGGSLFKFLPRPGAPTFPVAPHAELFAYALVPLYALYQHPSTLLVLQSVLLGAAALPLFAVARAHVRPAVASAIALAYLLYPALHAESLAGFHFLTLGPILLWSAWALLERRRGVRTGVPTVLASSLAILLTLTVREETTLWVFVMGVYFIVSGRRPVAGLLVAAAGILWLAVVNFAVLRRLGASEGLLAPYGGFVPPGKHGFRSVLAAVLSNPALVATTLADMPRLIYLLQMLLPLAFLPLRRPLWLLFFIPGFVLTLLPVEMVPIRSLASPYGAHWIAFLFPGVALGIEGLQRRGAPGTRPHIVALVGLFCATIPLAYQFSPLMEEKTAAVGGRPHAARSDDDGRRRRDDCRVWRASTTRVKG